jgi:hypothetical protein
MLAAHGSGCAATPPVVTPAPFGTKLGSNVLIYPDVDSSEHTAAPGLVPDRQIRGFLFAFPHPAACPRFDQYALEMSRKGSPYLPHPHPLRLAQDTGPGAFCILTSEPRGFCRPSWNL